MIRVDLAEWMNGVKEINKELNAGKPSLTELVNRQIQSASTADTNAQSNQKSDLSGGN